MEPAEATARVVPDFELVLAAADRAGHSKRGKKKVARRRDEAYAKFGGDHPDAETNVRLPVGGVVVAPDGQFEITILSSFKPRRESADATRLIYRIERVAQEAREWWPRPAVMRAGDRIGIYDRVTGFSLSPLTRKGRVDAERRPHSLEAFTLATFVLKAIADEQTAKREAGAQFSGDFEAKLAQFKEQLVLVESRLEAAIQRSAQTRYWWGAVMGGGFLLGFYFLLGLVFLRTHTPAYFGVAALAGGIGAMVSLLQRMSKGRLQLDTAGSRDLLVLFGGVRPLIGAVFGTFALVAIKGGLVTAFDVPAGQSLSFFAAVGFLSGFSERFAQDMLKVSSTPIGSSSDDEAEASLVRASAAG